MTLVDKSRFVPTPVFRARRKRVVVRVRVEGAPGESQDAMVRDISAAGMSAVARVAPPAANDLVTIALPDGSTLWGIVRWVEGKAFGVEFDKGSHAAAPSGLIEG
ncbi:PilZ domain-containing protein [Novosphingobium sp.]|uniref:PilZ domain-containing protein n=1 Tax=Novosphingobium sp. TaxID=1874826 RepID=UPI00261E40D9|nr:PilZ domain-containing protein [Novosphingobium sp.]